MNFKAQGRTNVELREEIVLASGATQSMQAFTPKRYESSSSAGQSVSILVTKLDFQLRLAIVSHDYSFLGIYYVCCFLLQYLNCLQPLHGLNHSLVHPPLISYLMFNEVYENSTFLPSNHLFF